MIALQIGSPRTKIPREGRSIEQQGKGRVDGSSIPHGNVAIKLDGRRKHARHVHNVGGLPAGQVLVELGRQHEHVRHVDHTLRIPRIQRLVEVVVLRKHALNRSQAGSVPTANGMIELRLHKHSGCIFH